ncbi:immunoglobulin-like domain-containing protein [Malaciobacter canalis]|nr:immunoglobulin-like domain-containing protein [Malaciobacter canalis]
MLKLMIKEANGEVKSLDVTENLVISPKAGQQFYFNNLDGHKYTMSLQDSEKSVVLNMDLGTTKVKIIFKNIVDSILEENIEDKNILGIIKDQEGLDELNQTVLNDDFKGDDVIKSLKDLLAQSSINPEETNGVIIDDFGSLTSVLEAAAAGGAEGDTSTFRPINFNDADDVNILGGRSRLDTQLDGLDSNIPDRDGTPGNGAGDTEVTITLSATSQITEDDNSITYTANLSTPALADMTITLSNGAVINISAGSTTGSVVASITPDPDVYKEDDITIDVTVSGTSGGGFDIVNSDTTASTTITDTIDTTNATLTSSISGDEDGATVTYKITLDTAPTNDETFTFKVDGVEQTIIVKAGETTGIVTIDFMDPDSIKDTTIIPKATDLEAVDEDGASNYENLQLVNNSKDETVEDSIDTTTVTVGNATVNEDATSATVEVKLEGHNFKDGETVTVKLSDGTEVTFTENGTKDATITVTADSDSIKEADSTTSITAEVSSSAGEIENPVVNAGELTVEDSIDTTTVTVGNATVNEDATSATVEVKLEGHNFKDGETVTVKLSDGTEVTFTENGTKDATITVTADSDSIKEADSTTSITAEVSSSAGEIENPVVNAGELTVEDSIDTTTVTVGNATVNEDATSATVEVKLEGHNFKDGETVTVKLSDGTEVTFTENGTKDATITVTADSDSIKEADSTTSITAEVSSSAGEIENPVVNAGELTVEDSIDTTTVTVGNATVNEDATSATVEVKLEGHNFKDGETVTVKLSDGTEVTFTENGTKDATITVTADSDSIKEADSTTSITAEVSSSAGEIENPVVNAGELTVEDSIDTTTVTVGNATVNEDATSATVEVKLEGHNFKDGETVTVKLSDGTEVTFTENGTKDATITVTADSDSIKEADSTTSITAEVSSSAGEIENPVVNAGELTVEDSIDTTTVTVGNATVNEDATSATVEVKLEGHNFKDGETVTVKLSDGTEVTFTENGTKDATITVTADSDSIKEADSTTSITAEVSSSAGEIENPVVNAGELTVEDSIDTTTVTVGNATVNEDATSATVEVKLEGHNFKDGETVTVKLSDGTEVTFTENGTKDATITVTADSDSIKEADSTTSITAEVSSSAGEIENPVVNAGELTVEDSIDTTTVTVGNATVNEDATSATVEVKLEGHNFKDGETVTVKLSDGTEVTFTENGTKDATITVTADSDSIKEADSTTSITAEVSSSAGEIENPVVNAGELTVEDSIDTTTVTVGNATVNEDATSATVEVKLEGHNFKDGETVTVKLSDGTEVTFTENGTKDATITVTADSDSIKEADSTTSITAEVSSSAGEIENPVVNAGELTVEDSIDTTTVTVGNATVNEDATSATVEVKLEGHNFKDGETVTVKLSDGTEVTFTENGTKDATITVTADSDSIKEADSTTSITAEVSSSAGEIENPVVNAGELTVEDSIDTTTVTVGNATVNEDATSATVEVKLEGHNFKDGETVTVKLSDGTEVTFTENGTKDATITVTADSDSIKEADSTTSITAEVSSSAGEIENPVVNAGELTVEDSIDTTTVTVGNATVNEDATSATVEVKLEGHNFKDGETVTVKLSDGTEVTFTENGTKDATITVTADSDSIKEADSTTSITAEVSSSAGEIENPVVNAGELTVEDSIDTTTVTVGNATVNEDATSATVEVKLEGHNFKDGETVTVKLSDGTEVTFTENGTKDATITVTADSDSIKEADSTTSITAEVSSSAGEIENPVVNAGELTVEDSIDTTTVTVGNATVNEDATSATVEVKLEGHNFKDGETVTVKLSDGTEVTFTENGTKDATITVTADSDSIKEADSTTSITAEVSSSAGEIENPVVNAGELTVEDSIDTTTVTVGNATVNEDATSATVEVKLEGHNFKDGETVTVKLSDGTEVTFTENGTKDATITVTADSDSIKEADSTTSITAEVSSSAGEIENPVVNAGELTVEDSIDTTTVTVGNATVNEDATSATVEVKLEGHNFKDGETVTVKLSDGTEVTFTENGTKDATITVTADSDSIKEADSTTSITAEVSSSAGEIENPVVNAGELTVEDSIDTTTVTVGNATVNEDATSATVEVKLEGHNFKDGETVTVKLSDGTEVTFTENGTKDATITVTADSDSIKEADSTTSITAEVSSSAGEIENPVVNAGELTVEDSIDTTTVTVGNATVNEDATSATVEVKLEGHNFKDGETVTVKLSDGTEVTFTENGTKDATITVTADSDSIKEADSTTSITAEVSSSAGEIENPVVNAGELTVEDSIDTTTVTVGNATVNEDATSATVEVKLEGHNFKDGETVTVKLSDGTEVTFTENGTKDATITVTADSDSIKEADSTTSITAEVSSSAGEIENPVVNAGELTVEDSIDTTTVTVGNATVNEDATSATVEVKLEGHNFKDGETVTVKLSDGTEVTFTENGTKDATITVTADSDSIKEADSTTSITAEVSSSAGEIENPVVNAGELTVEDSIDTTTVTVGNATVNEDATSATVEVKLEGHNFKDGETVTVKLSDGTEVTFTENGTKDATITVTADSDSIKEADSTTSITAEVSSSAGEIENPVVNAGELTVEDSIDTTTVTVGNATVNEDATSATVEVKLEGHNFKDGETVTVKLSDGTEVTFTENGTKDATITVTADSDSIKEADSTTSITAEVSSSAGEIENPVVNAGELTVEDSIDTTTVTVGNATVNEDATSATVEVKLEGHNFKDGETVTVKLSDGTEVTFTENGTKDATITVTADSDSIKEADSTTSITAEVSSSAGEIENPVVNAGELTVEDSIDTTTVTVGNATVNEDATSATVEVKLEGHNFKDGETVTVKLSDGTEVTFTENGTKDATITVTADSDSIKEADSTTSITAEVSSSAGEIENPVVNAGELTVEDSIDTTTVTVGNATVNEDATSATVEVKLEGHNFKDGETVTVKLSDGTEVTFTENGTKDATITVTADSDSIKEADSTTSITAEVSSSAGEIENPVVNAGELTVEDSIDTTTVTVGNATVNEDATSATVEVKLEGHNFKDGETVTVKLSDGTEVTFTENGTKDATITVTADSDSIKEADSTTSITAEVSSSAGEIENPVVNAGELTVEDSIDTTTVTVGNATVNEDATSATVEVKLEGHNFKDGETVTVKLSDGTEVTFTENGTKDATITVTADSDSIKEADSTTSITAEVSSSAGEIENPVVNAGELTVEDSIDTTTVTVGNATVNEDATSATVEVKLEGHNFKDGETVTVKLSDGTEVTFTENGTKDATITVTADSDSIKEADSTTSITAEVSSSAGEIENPVVNAGELTVEDSIDTTTVTVGNATVNEDATSATVEVKLEGHNFKDGETVTVKLSDGTEVTFTENGTKDATITVTADSDSIKEADSTTSITAEVSSSAGEIENPVVNAGELTVEDSIDTTTVTVGNATVNEDATSATVEVKLEGHNFKDGETVTVKLSDGTEVTFTENGTKDATITVTADSDSIKEADSTTSITAEVSSSAGEIENPVVNAGELTVEDSIDTTTVTVGNATVNEDATSATVEVKLEGHNFKDGETVTVKLSDGTEVTFTENGTKDATITVTADSDSIKEADSTTSITAEVSSSAGEIENPVVNAGELTVEDSIDTTTVTVGNATVNEDATSATVEVKLEGHNFKDGETVTVKLSDGTEVTFTENGTKDATITVTADSDSIKEADSTTSITAEVSSSAGEIENPVVNAGELTVEDSIDTTTVTVGNATVNEDATSATVEVKLEGHNFKDGETVTVKLSDGTEVTFTENGTKDATITVTADSDSIKEADSTTSITAEVSSSAGEIENPVVNAGELTVEDSIDTTTVTVGNATVNEDATSATVEVKLEGHNFKDGETVTVKLSDGTEVTFTENGTKDATITVTADSDSIKEADSTTSITAEVSSSAGEIENQ